MAFAETTNKRDCQFSIFTFHVIGHYCINGTFLTTRRPSQVSNETKFRICGCGGLCDASVLILRGLTNDDIKHQACKGSLEALCNG